MSIHNNVIIDLTNNIIHDDFNNATNYKFCDNVIIDIIVENLNNDPEANYIEKGLCQYINVMDISCEYSKISNINWWCEIKNAKIKNQIRITLS